VSGPVAGPHGRAAWLGRMAFAAKRIGLLITVRGGWIGPLARRATIAATAVTTVLLCFTSRPAPALAIYTQPYFTKIVNLVFENILKFSISLEWKFGLGRISVLPFRTFHGSVRRHNFKMLNSVSFLLSVIF